MPESPAVRIYGVGNRLRGDDGVGLYVADRLRESGFAATSWTADLTGLLEEWVGAERVILIDAMEGGGAPGSVHRLQAGAVRLEGGRFRFSSHGMGLAEAIELALALGRAPCAWEICAIVGECFGYGETLSPAVREGAEALVRQLSAEIRQATR